MKNWIVVWVKSLMVSTPIVVLLVLLSGVFFPDIVFNGKEMTKNEWYYYFQGMFVYILISEMHEHYKHKENNQ